MSRTSRSGNEARRRDWIPSRADQGAALLPGAFMTDEEFDDLAGLTRTMMQQYGDRQSHQRWHDSEDE